MHSLKKEMFMAGKYKAQSGRSKFSVAGVWDIEGGHSQEEEDESEHRRGKYGRR